MLLNVHMIPHGDELIDLPDRESMRLNSVITKTAASETAEVIVILSPHGLTLEASASVAMTQYLSGYLNLSGRIIRRRYHNERGLAKEIAEKSSGLFQKFHFITSSGTKSVFPLDFGSLIPLSFFQVKNICAIGQPKINDRPALRRMGEILFRAINDYEKSVSVIFSCDQAHTHSAEGPYGYSPHAAEYDEIVRKYIESGDPQDLQSLPDSFLGEAKPDSYWNLMIMDGLLRASGKRMRFIDYYVALYFGMMVATTKIKD